MLELKSIICKVRKKIPKIKLFFTKLRKKNFVEGGERRAEGGRGMVVVAFFLGVG